MASLGTIAVTDNADSLRSLISSSNSAFSSHESSRSQASHLSVTRGFSCVTSISTVSQTAKSTAQNATKVLSGELIRIKSITSHLREADMAAVNGFKIK